MTAALRGALLALALTALCAAGPARSQEDGAAARARELLAALAAGEAATPMARLTMTITDRRGELPAGESFEDTRRRLQQQSPTVAEGVLVYSREAWVKDLTIRLLRPDGATMRTRSGMAGGVLRILMEARAGTREERQGRLLRAESPVPAEAILTRRAARALEGVTWVAADAAGSGETSRITLKGRRGEERHELEVSGAPGPRILSWKLVRTLTSPAGERLEQQYLCEVTPGPAPEPLGYLEEYVLVPSAGSAVSRVTQVRRTEALQVVRPDELAVKFPPGTAVTDSRGAVPVEYQQTQEGVDEDDVAEAARQLAEGRARAGDRAPEFTLRGERNRTVRLAEFRGKPLAMYWFSPVFRGAAEVGGQIARVSEEYRKRGVAAIVILGSGEVQGPWEAQAEALRRRYNWTLPVLLDADGEAMRVYGLVAAVPKVAIVDGEGRLTYVQPGFDSAAVRRALDAVAQPAR
jgi:peroxiredoxin